MYTNLLYVLLKSVKYVGKEQKQQASLFAAV